MDRNSRQGIFFGIIAVATLIVAMIGATLAYFSAVSKGTENAVSAQADQINISYTEGTVLNAVALIPASESVAKAGYKKQGTSGEQCIDDNGKEVCSVYHFEVENLGTNEKSITGKLTVVENGFTYLRYIVYDSNTGEIILDSTPLTAQAGETVSLFGLTGENYNTVAVPGQGKKAYDVVIYLFESGPANDEEQGKKFTATASVEVTGGSTVTGEIQNAG